MHHYGLPAPILQVRIYDPDGTFVGRVDLGYPEFGVLIEFDGLVKYQRPLHPGQTAEDVVIAEKVREDRIRALGYVVLRFVWSDLSNPAGMAAKITSALEQGRRFGAAGGLTGTWTADPAAQVPSIGAV